jgi:hypothetical protein
MKNDKKQEDPPGQPWTSSGLLTCLLILDLPFKVTSCISPIKGNGKSTTVPSIHYILQCAILFSAIYQQCTNKWTVQIKVIKVIWYLEVIVRVKKWSFSKTTILQHNLKHSSKSENTWVLEITIWTLSSKTKPLPLHWFKHLSYFIDLFWLTGHYLNKNIRT